MGEIIIVIAKLMHAIIMGLQLLIFVHVVLSWMAYDVPLNQVTRFLYAIVEKIYQPIRSILPTAMGGVDFTPMIALLALYVLDVTLVSTLLSSGYRWPR